MLKLSVKNNVEQKTLRDSMNTHLCTWLLTCLLEGMVRGWQADGMMGLLHFCSQVIAYYIGKY